MTEVRTRFAPSPTGHVHIGGLRTALYNYLFAKKHGGSFILRIEDTDRARLVEGAKEGILRVLTWSGLVPDESYARPGKVGPYIQSERLAIYQAYCEQLIAEKKAYYCFASAAELEESRRLQQKQGIQAKYNRKWLPEEMGGTMPMKKVAEALDESMAGRLPRVVRMKVPDERGAVIIKDAVRGSVEFDVSVIDDQVLLKSDGYPTYHLGVVVDDYLMEITHVIRGEEWLSSAPKHVLLYEYFGWASPVFAHVPLLLSADRTKLSKRQGDVAVEDYVKKGYSAEAILNFVALLGWNEGGGEEQEIYGLDELVEKFSLERVGRSGAVFNIEKLGWFEKMHIRRTSDAELVKKIAVYLRDVIGTRISLLPVERIMSEEYLVQVAELMKERVDFVSEFVTFGDYLFFEPKEYDEEGVRKRWRAGTNEFLLEYADRLEDVTPFTVDRIEGLLKDIAVAKGVKTAEFVHPVRIAITGATFGPSLYHIMELIGREVSVSRLRKAAAGVF